MMLLTLDKIVFFSDEQCAKRLCTGKNDYEETDYSAHNEIPGMLIIAIFNQIF